MSGLFWKIPLVLAIVLPAAAAGLVMRSQHHEPHGPAALPAALRPPPDGLESLRKSALAMVDLETLRCAVDEFNTKEGRPPTSLYELEEFKYLNYARVKPDLRRFRYDPATATVVPVTQ